MAKNKTCSDYISSNDFEGAKERFDNANARWKFHWLETCQTIMENCKEWAKKYIINPIECTITKIKDHIKKTKSFHIGSSNTYLIKMYDDNGNWVYTKIGKANVIAERLKSFINHTYKTDNVTISNTELIKSYELPSDDLAQVLESFMRNYFKTKKSKKFIPNDRFEAFEPSDEDLQVFEKYYEIVMQNA